MFVAGDPIKNNFVFKPEDLHQTPAIIDVTGKDFVKCPNCRLPIKINVRTISMKRLEFIQGINQLAKTELFGLG